MPAHLDRARVLSLDPYSRGFGFAVLEDADMLVDWGTSRAWEGGEDGVARRMKAILDRYQPVLIVLEDAGNRRGRRVVQTLACITELASSRGIAIRQVSRGIVRDALRRLGPTRHDVVLALSRLFPELEPRLPRRRKGWMSEDDRTNLFDAVALAYVFAVADRQDYGQRGRSLPTP